MALKNRSGMIKREMLGGVKGIMDGLDALAASEVLVGFPRDAPQRKPDELGTDEKERPITNAALGYIHDNGAPEVNIPARPFMIPGITNAKSKLVKIAKRTSEAVLHARDPVSVVQQGYHAMGLVAQSSIRAVINDGVDPPLSDRTLRERARRGRMGAKQELKNRAGGLPPGKDLAKPLIDTGQMRNAVTYVIRGRKNGKG